MKTRIGALTALVAALACGTAAAAPLTVNVRVEGAHKTIFDGNVKTSPHAISKDSTGSHPCDGTNNGANSKPGPTVHSALDDASKAGHFTWAATWSTSFNDFFVTRIGPDTGTGSSFWAEAVNFKDTSVGGCQQELKPGDHVLFYFVASGTSKFTLELKGPHSAHAGRAFKVHVIDGKTGKAVKGAKVDGHRTNAHGVASLRFRRAGTERLRATLPGSVRSNVLVVRVR
jgi:hypothetical protein